MKIDGFDWDAGNLMKNEEKHGILRESIELFFQKKPWVGPDLKHSDKEVLKYEQAFAKNEHR